MADTFTITRQIGIDAGHRVMRHGSKCKNLHGHRYTVHATCEAPLLIPDGEQAGMVLDFGFLKDEMMHIIDAHCDHGTIVEFADETLLDVLADPSFKSEAWRDHVKELIDDYGYFFTDAGAFGKIYVIKDTPTAENLAKHWFERLKPKVLERSDGYATLLRIDVWETPNCMATYHDKE